MSESGSPFGDRVSTVMALGGAMRVEAPRPPKVDGLRLLAKAKGRHGAIEDDRTRLARDLHDGVLQVLAGVTLQLAAASNLIATDPDAARRRLDEIANLLAEEQRELRGFVHRLKPGVATSMASCAELAAILEKLRKRAEQLGGMRVDLAVTGRADVPRSLVDEIYRIVQEALANVARHAHARSARVEVAVGFDQVRIAISDDGVGFSYRGEYDMVALDARNWGPLSIMSRVAALKGRLVLTSSLSGASLEICLPIEQPALDWLHGSKARPRKPASSGGD